MKSMAQIRASCSYIALPRWSTLRMFTVRGNVIVIRNSFAFSKLDKFKTAILYKIFAKIDKNNDGLITFD